ncbi:MAG: histidine phosphatase family protein [Ktedonobacteraceae bacterium]
MQAAALANFLAQASIQQVVSSPFTRAILSIEPLAKRLGLNIVIDPRLAERVLGVGPLPNWLELLQKSFIDLDLCLTGGESSRMAMNRAVSATQDILKHSITTTAIVTHGNLMTLLLKYFDDTISFETWRSLTNPDVFRVTIMDNEANVVRIWQTEVNQRSLMQRRL